MNASLPFGPPINTDIDYYQAYFFFFLVSYAMVGAWFVREENYECEINVYCSMYYKISAK